MNSSVTFHLLHYLRHFYDFKTKRKHCFITNKYLAMLKATAMYFYSLSRVKKYDIWYLKTRLDCVWDHVLEKRNVRKCIFFSVYCFSYPTVVSRGVESHSIVLALFYPWALNVGMYFWSPIIEQCLNPRGFPE